MAIIKLSYPWLKEQYLKVFPDQNIQEGSTIYQMLNYISAVSDRNLDNILESISKSNLYTLVGDDLVNALGKLGYVRLEGYKAKIRIAIDAEQGQYVGEPFSIIQNDISYDAICYSQEESSDLILLNIETVNPVELIFLSNLDIEYKGNLDIKNIQKISLLFSGRLRESDIAFRERVLIQAPIPHMYRFLVNYENIFLEPAPEITYLSDGNYNLFYPDNNVSEDQLFYLYIGLNNTVPTQSNLTGDFVERELKVNDNVFIKFGYNIYGEVSLQLLVYLKNNVDQDEKNKIIELLKSYSYTPTITTPIYSSDIISHLESLGINSVSNISFLYNNLTNLQLSFQDKKRFKLLSSNPIIFQ